MQKNRYAWHFFLFFVVLYHCATIAIELKVCAKRFQLDSVACQRGHTTTTTEEEEEEAAEQQQRPQRKKETQPQLQSQPAATAIEPINQSAQCSLCICVCAGRGGGGGMGGVGAIGGKRTWHFMLSNFSQLAQKS